MRRRDFIILVGGVAARPLHVRAQPLHYAMSSEKRIGSIDGGSNVLTLTETSNFQVGNQVIVEVGGETGQGKFGTMGVGGVVPAATDKWSAFYYRSKDCPLALVAKVTAIGDGGRTLMLDKPAATSTMNANVYFDNYRLLNTVLNENRPAGWRITLPAGDFAISDMILHSYYSGWVVSGAGKDATTLRWPKGTICSGIHCFQANNTEFHDFTIVGNAGQNGFGLKEHGGRIQYGVGIEIARSGNCVVRNASCVNVFHKAVWGESAYNLSVFDCDVRIDDPVRAYVSWWFGAADSRNCIFTDCKIKSSYLVGGFEGFRSDGVKFIRCNSVNATFSMNSTGNFLIDSPSVTITAHSQFDNASFHFQNPMFNINSNIQPPSPAMQMGGIIRNVILTCEGYINANKDSLRGIVINSDNSNITIDGGRMTYPDYAAPSEMPGACGVNSTGANTQVKNLTVIGTVNPNNYPGANIAVANGIVTNCRASRIVVAGVLRAGQ